MLTRTFEFHSTKNPLSVLTAGFISTDRRPRMFSFSRQLGSPDNGFYSGRHHNERVW